MEDVPTIVPRRQRTMNLPGNPVLIAGGGGITWINRQSRTLLLLNDDLEPEKEFALSDLPLPQAAAKHERVIVLPNLTVIVISLDRVVAVDQSGRQQWTLAYPNGRRAWWVETPWSSTRTWRLPFRKGRHTQASQFRALSLPSSALGMAPTRSASGSWMRSLVPKAFTRLAAAAGAAVFLKAHMARTAREFGRLHRGPGGSRPRRLAPSTVSSVI